MTASPQSRSGFSDQGNARRTSPLCGGSVHRIFAIIAERKLAQLKASKLFGIDQPKISALMRGKLDGFSTDRLFRFLNALGSDVEIVIRPARSGEEADTRVVTA